MEHYTDGSLMNNPIYDQTLYNCGFSNTFKWKLGHNVKVFLVELQVVIEKNDGEYVIWPAKLVPTSLIQARNANQLVISLRRYNVQRKIPQWRVIRMMSQRLVVVLLWVLNETIELSILHNNLSISMHLGKTPNIKINSWNAAVCTHLPNLPCKNWKRCIRMNKNTDPIASVIMEQVNGEGDLDSDYSHFAFRTVINDICKGFAHQCIDGEVGMLNSCAICQSNNILVPGNNYSLAGFPATKFLT